MCKSDRSDPRPKRWGPGAVLRSIDFLHTSLIILRISPWAVTKWLWPLYILRHQNQIGNIPLDVCKKSRLARSEAASASGTNRDQAIRQGWLALDRAGWRRLGRRGWRARGQLLRGSDPRQVPRSSCSGELPKGSCSQGSYPGAASCSGELLRGSCSGKLLKEAAQSSRDKSRPKQIP